MSRRFLSWRDDRRGNIAISTALCLPLIISALALGVDYGYLTLQQRELQTTADLSAISAASTPTNPESAVMSYIALNNRNIAVLKNGQLLSKGAPVAFNAATVFDKFEAYAEITKGHFQQDSKIAIASRFQANTAPYDAVRITLHQKGGLFFGGNIVEAPRLSASGVATVDKMAAFSVGSRLASLNNGVINSLLGKLLGTTISLSAMDYQSLANANVDVLKILDKMAIKLNLTAGTYDDVLKTDIGFGAFLNAITQTTGISPAVSSILKTLEKTLDKSKLTIKLKDVVSVGPLGTKPIGQTEGMAIQTDLFELISAGANVANGSKQVDLDLGATIPGLASVSLSVAVGQPPVGTSSLAVAKVGGVVRTAQTRVALTAAVDGITGLLGIRLKIPLYLEVAHGEATIASITCSSGSSGPTVNIDAIPGVLELSLGDVDKSAFANFGADPKVTKAKLVAIPAIAINALAYANATNMKVDHLSFSPADIAAQKVRTASSQNTVSTLMNSLIKDLRLEVDLLGIRVAVPPAILGGLADTLRLVTVPLDQILYSVLSTLGIKVGEIDVRVGGASCHNPVLVQ